MNQERAPGVSGGQLDQSRPPLYVQIYRDILEQINSGVYPTGSKLPSEKELAAQYGVSRITSKKAMDTLAARGYISRTPGRGTFVLRCDEEAAPQTAAEGGKLIGVVIEKFSSSFGGDLVLGIERECTRLGYTLALRCTYHSKAAEETAIAELLELGVVGLIIMCVYDETYNPLILKLSLENFPVVLVDRELSGIPLPCVATDNKRAAKQLTDALFARGHKRLTFTVAKGSFRTSTVEERAEGFAQSCMEHGAPVDRKGWVTGLSNLDSPYSREEFQVRMAADIATLKRYMLSHPEVTGYVAASYDVAYLAQQADQECFGVTGTRRCIACFDAPESVFRPEPLLHIRQDQEEIGRVAVRHLMGRIQKKQLPRMTYVPFELAE